MDELIRRSDAIKAVNRAKAEGMTECPTYYLGTVPSADYLTSVYMVGYNNGYEKGKADRPQGEWRNLDGEPVPLDEGGCPTESAWCSECGTWLVASDEYSVIGRFCPNCGARMKGADDE